MTHHAAIIGAGFIGERFGGSLQKHKEVLIKRIYDIIPEKALKLSEKFKAQVSTFDEILEDEEIDIVYVGTPPKYHAELSIKALEARKNVICEKPIALSQNQVKEMIEARERSGKITTVNLPFRFHVEFDAIKEIIDEREIGNITTLEIRLRLPEWPRSWQKVEWLNYAEQGGPLREIGTHYFFGIEELFGKIDQVKAWTNYPGDGRCETQSIALFHLKNGFTCNMNLIIGGVEQEENTFIIYGDEGTIYHKNWSQVFVASKTETKELHLDRINSEFELVSHFIRAIEGDTNAKSRLVSFEEAGRAQWVLEQILEST